MFHLPVLLPLYLLPLTLDDLGLMDTAALLLLLLDFFFQPFKTKGRMDVSLADCCFLSQFATFTQTLPSATGGEWILPLFSGPLHASFQSATFCQEKHQTQALGGGQRWQLSPATARPEHTPQSASVT